MSTTSIINNYETPLSWESNLFENSALDAFYLSKEAVFAYAKNQGTLNRRGIALQVREILDSFLHLKFLESEIKFIDSIIKRDVDILSQQNEHSDVELLPKLRLTDPQGFALLEIESNINLDLLKKLYKKAAKKHHPDLGGSTLTMQKLNEAYGVFFEIINNAGFDVEMEANCDRIVYAPQCWDDWLYAIHLVLSCINGDFLAADYAFEHLKQADDYSRKSANLFIGGVYWSFFIHKYFPRIWFFGTFRYGARTKYCCKNHIRTH
jgi:hypothetical protein